MMPYYKKVEEEAGRISESTFGGKSTYAKNTKDQVSFDFRKSKIRYLCYVDINNEFENKINII